MKKRWADALCDTVEAETGEREFTYVTAVTFVDGDPKAWEEYQPFRRLLRNNRIHLLELNTMLEELKRIAKKTVASSDIGRILQLMKAAEEGTDALKKTLKAQG